MSPFVTAVDQGVIIARPTMRDTDEAKPPLSRIKTHESVPKIIINDTIFLS